MNKQRFIDIGRGTLWGNPIHHTSIMRPGETLPAYEAYLRAKAKRNPYFQQCLVDLALAIEGGSRLRCPGCGVDSPTCHGRVLERIAAQQLAAMRATADAEETPTRTARNPFEH